MKQSHEHLPETYIDIIDSNEPNAVTKDYSENSEPIEDIRVLFGFQLIKMAFEFLIWHEFAHIIYGHVDYVRSILGNPKLEIRKMKIHSIDRKTFELTDSSKSCLYV